jgi:hypothetical protein
MGRASLGFVAMIQLIALAQVTKALDLYRWLGMQRE